MQHGTACILRDVGHDSLGKALGRNAHGCDGAVEDVDAVTDCQLVRSRADACTAVEQQGALVEVEDVCAVLLRLHQQAGDCAGLLVAGDLGDSAVVQVALSQNCRGLLCGCVGAHSGISNRLLSRNGVYICGECSARAQDCATQNGSRGSLQKHHIWFSFQCPGGASGGVFLGF